MKTGCIDDYCFGGGSTVPAEDQRFLDPYSIRRRPFARLFPTEKDRKAFATVESRRIDELIDSLPEPKVGAQRREYSGKLNVRVPKSLHAALAGKRGGN